MSKSTWLEADGQSAAEHPATRLRRLIDGPGILCAPGAHDALSGLLARQAGFACLYISGAALTASRGLPDLGILTMQELCNTTRSIARATALPLIVDGDTGYGEALNAMRLVRELEDAGAAAVQIEDQVLPKKCGHLNDKTLIPPADMAHKIAAARRASSRILIIARTDAAVHSLDEAIDRSRLYLAAGADVIFPEALTDDDQFRTFARAIDAPLLANMTEFGKTPYRTASEFEALGFKIVIWPVSSLRIAAKAISELYAELASSGTTKELLHRMQTRSELYETIGYSDFEALDESITRSTVPVTPVK